MRRNFSILTIMEYLSVLFIALIIFIPIFYSEIYLGRSMYNDFAIHTELAQNILEAPQKVPKIYLAHSAWQWAVVVTHEIIGKSWLSNAFIVTLSSALLTVGILFWLLQKNLITHPAGALAICLTIVAPLAFLFPLDHGIYLGYIGINTYHNPTILLLKPLAILQFYFSAEALKGKDSDWKGISLAAFVSLASAFSKPSYGICLLPSLGILTLIRIWRKKPINLKMLFLGIGLPSVAILIWQFLFVYGSNEGSSIIFAPFLVMSHLSSNLPIKFILSIVFPLIVTAVFWRESIKDIRIQLGWIGFGMGTIFTYFFAESGYYLNDGNFVWSGQITLFILFVCCILFLSEKKLPGKNSISRWLILYSGSLHIIFGIFYYLIILINLKYP
jgi:hypothetical protein